MLYCGSQCICRRTISFNCSVLELKLTVYPQILLFLWKLWYILWYIYIIIFLFLLIFYISDKNFFFGQYNESHWVSMLFWTTFIMERMFFKNISLVFCRRNSYSFGTEWRWVNYDVILFIYLFFCVWTIPLITLTSHVM